jgi:pimeloyl-ACP methyl ester carboxylesterase
MKSSHSYKVLRRGRRRKIDVRDVQYNVTEWGDSSAPLFIYLHGWADTGATFQFVVDALHTNWHIVAPDWRGFGRSTVNCTSYWFPDYLADLHELLEIYSPDQPARIVGHSMGGNIATLYAGTMPERVRAIINMEGFGLVDSDSANAPLRYRQWIEAGRSVPAFTVYPDVQALSRRIAKRNPLMSFAQAEFVAREWSVETGDGRIELRADPRHKLPNPVLYRRAEAEACWKAIKADILLVKGGTSDLASHFDSIEGISCPGDKTVVIDGVGHMPHFEAPLELANIIEAFLIKYL